MTKYDNWLLLGTYGVTVEDRDKLRRELISLQEETGHEEKTELSGLDNKIASHFQTFQVATLSIINSLREKTKSRIWMLKPLF